MTAWTKNPPEENRPIGATKFEAGLPDHLKGKRPKDMTQEEKKEYNNFRRKASRKNESTDHAAYRKEKEAASETVKGDRSTNEEEK